MEILLNQEPPNPMFKYFKQKYKRCLDPNDETSSCFSFEHFSYDSDVEVDKGNLVIIISIGLRRVDVGSNHFLIAFIYLMR